MIPIPAIDIKDGKVVRLLHGDFNEEKVYFSQPEIAARHFEEEGAFRIHVVDLDGALKGAPKNMASVEKILKTVKTPLEVGGGVRDLKIAEEYFSMGVSWVILGTKACLDPGLMEEALVEFKDKIIVGIDARDGLVATDGWTKMTKINATALALQIQALGGRGVIYTDISKDGALGGPNLKEIRSFCQAVTLEVIASGGVSSLKDVQALLDLKQKNLTGVIIGKALYENRFKIKDAIGLCSQNVSFPA